MLNLKYILPIKQNRFHTSKISSNDTRSRTRSNWRLRSSRDTPGMAKTRKNTPSHNQRHMGRFRVPSGRIQGRGRNRTGIFTLQPFLVVLNRFERKPVCFRTGYNILQTTMNFQPEYLNFSSCNQTRFFIF